MKSKNLPTSFHSSVSKPTAIADEGSIRRRQGETQDGNDQEIAFQVRSLAMEMLKPALVLARKNCQIIYVEGEVDRFIMIPEGGQKGHVLKMAIPGLQPTLSAAFSRCLREDRQIEVERVQYSLSGNPCIADLQLRPVRLARYEDTLVLIQFIPRADGREGARNANAELQRLNNDLENLLASSQIATVFLDTLFRIRRFTPQALTLFNLNPTDIGRPITDLMQKFADDGFLDDAREVLGTLKPKEQEVISIDGCWFLRRILPYRTADNLIEGIVVTFHDVDILKRYQSELQKQRERLRLITDHLPVLISYVDKEGRYQFANKRYEQWFGIPLEQIVGQRLEDILGSEAFAAIKPRVDQAFAGAEVTWEDELPYRLGGTRFVRGSYVPEIGPDGEVMGFFVLVSDITDRRKDEIALKQSEAEFRAIFELGGSAKAMADVVTGTLVLVNRKLCDLTGYSESELLGMTYRQLTYPQDRDADDARIAVVLSGEREDWTSQKRLLRKDGGWIWVLVSGSLLRDPEGRPYRTVSTLQDLTFIKQTEEFLSQNEAKQRALVQELESIYDVSPVGMAVLDRSHRFVRINAAMARINGLPKEQHFGRTGYELFPELKGPLKEAIEGVFQANRPLLNCESEVVFEGSRRWFITNHVPLVGESGAVEHVIQTVFEITEAKKSELRVFEAERRLALAIEAADAVPLERSAVPEENEKLSRRYVELLGFSEDEVRDMPFDEFMKWMMSRIHPEDLPKVHKWRQQFYEGEIQKYEVIFRSRHKNGHWVWLRSVGQATERTPSGGMRWMVGLLQDITSTKETEEKLREADRSKDEFLAMLAHELRNPMAAIRHGIRLWKAPSLAKEKREWVDEMMDRQTRQLNRLIDDLLDVSRITRGKINLKLDWTALNPVMESALGSVRNLIEAGKFDLHACLPDPPVLLRADSSRLQQILVNLLTNACKYSDKGGMIGFRAFMEETCVVLEVSDSGIGLSPDELDSIFVLFCQSSYNGDKGKNGLGIGLTLVKSLVELHGGTVWARSEGRGKGSTFTVRLPIEGPPAH